MNRRDLLLLELVRAEDLQPLLHLLGSEPPVAALKILKHFIDRDVLLKFCNDHRF